MVAGPRNHLDLLSEPGRPKTAGLLIRAHVAELEDAGEFAPDLDPQPLRVRHRVVYHRVA